MLMKKIFYSLIFVVVSTIGFAQTESAKEFYNSGNLKLDKKEYKEAINDYDKAIELNKKFSEAYYNRALAKNYLKDYKGAIADYSESLELDSTNIQALNALNNRGLAKKALEDYDGAVEDYTKAINLNESFASAYFNRGSVKVLMDENGCEDFRKALDLGNFKAMEYIDKYCK